MGYKVRFEDSGPYVEAATMQEAIALIRAASNGHVAQGEQQTVTEPPSPVPTPEQSFQRFLDAINERAHSFLVMLLKYPNGIKGDALGQELHEETTAFGGILGGISKRAESSGISVGDIVVSEFKTEGISRYRFLQPGRLLVRHRSLVENPLIR